MTKIHIPSRRVSVLATAAGLVLAAYVAAGAQGSYVYPAKGQSPQQQAQDEAQCRSWAAQQGGTAPPPPQGHAGGTVRGGARGAAGGAAVGAIAGDAGKGAAIGAVVGGVKGRRDSKRAAAGAQAGAAANTDRAFAACMEGRGYTVK
jgi:hypothetical protein